MLTTQYYWQTHDKLQNLVTALDRSSKEKSLRINENKIELMVITKDDQPPRTNIKVDTMTIKQTENLNSGGSKVMFHGRGSKEIRK